MPNTTSTPRARQALRPDACPTVVMRPLLAACGTWAAMRSQASQISASGWVSADAHPARQRRAEAFARHHRHCAALQQAKRESLARQAGGAHVDQREHPGLGAVHPQARHAVQAVGDQRGAAGKALDHAARNRRGPGYRQRRHVGDEGLIAEQHGFRQRQQPRRRIRPDRRTSQTGSPAPHGIWRSTRRQSPDRPAPDHPAARRRPRRQTPDPRRPRRRGSTDHAPLPAAPRAAISSGRSTAPVGLCGVFRNSTRVCGVIRAATSSACMRKPCSGRSGTGTIVAPGRGDQPFVGGIHRIADQHLVARLRQRHQHGVKRRSACRENTSI